MRWSGREVSFFRRMGRGWMELFYFWAKQKIEKQNKNTEPDYTVRL
jgi:hypothetical protein